MTGHLSNAQLGRLLNITASGASRLRNGDRMPGPAVLQRLSDLFGVPLETLLAPIIEARAGNPDPWVTLLDGLTRLPVTAGSSRA